MEDTGKEKDHFFSLLRFQKVVLQFHGFSDDPAGRFPTRVKQILQNFGISVDFDRKLIHSLSTKQEQDKSLVVRFEKHDRFLKMKVFQGSKLLLSDIAVNRDMERDDFFEREAFTFLRPIITELHKNLSLGYILYFENFHLRERIKKIYPPLLQKENFTLSFLTSLQAVPSTGTLGLLKEARVIYLQNEALAEDPQKVRYIIFLRSDIYSQGLYDVFSTWWIFYDRQEAQIIGELIQEVVVLKNQLAGTSFKLQRQVSREGYYLFQSLRRHWEYSLEGRMYQKTGRERQYENY